MSFSRGPTLGALVICATSLLSWSVLVAPTRAALPTTTASWWHVEASVAPTILPRGPKTEGLIVLTITNAGDAAIDATATTPVTIADVLPAALKTSVSGPSSVSAIEGATSGTERVREKGKELKCKRSSLSCTVEETIAPYASLIVHITFKEIALNAPSDEENEVTVTGGGVSPVSLRRPVAVGDAPTLFGVEEYELTPEGEDGSLDEQAGAHPFS
ncbi:MAG TPA: hypothetical protein VGL54_05385 [Solirubrobacteraceae bacterium]